MAQALCTSRTGFMRGSRNFYKAGVGGGGGGGGGGGVEARRPENSLDNVFFSHQLILLFTEWIQWFYYRGEKGVQLLPGGGGVQRNPCNLDPLTPPLDPHVRSPDATVCLQNHDLSKFK